MLYKIILDTNFYYSAVGFDNVLYRLLFFLIKNNNIYKLYISSKTLEELTNKLNSGKFDQKTKNKISSIQKNQFINLIDQFCTKIEPKKQVHFCRDPDDDIFLELAQEIKADYIITGDQDLLILKQFQNTSILKPSEFITQMGLSV